MTKDDLDYEYIADWIKSNGLSIRDGGRPVDSMTNYYLSVLSGNGSKSEKYDAVKRFMEDAGYDSDLDSILSITQMPVTTADGVSIGGNTISTELLPSYSTDAQNAYDSALQEWHNKVNNGSYDYTRGEYEYGKTVDDFMDSDTNALVKNAQETAFQKDWLGGNDYGAQIKQAQAGVDEYQSLYDEALTALNQDRTNDYDLWKNEADYLQSQKDRQYSQDTDVLTALQYAADKESSQNQSILDTLSNLGTSYAELMANQGVNNGSFLDQLNDAEYQRLTGQNRNATTATGTTGV
jgi:hypothetical protein